MPAERSVVRPVAREFARELTSEELALVHGGGSGVNQSSITTFCDVGTVENGTVEHQWATDDFR